MQQMITEIFLIMTLTLTIVSIFFKMLVLKFNCVITLESNSEIATSINLLVY